MPFHAMSTRRRRRALPVVAPRLALAAAIGLLAVPATTGLRNDAVAASAAALPGRPPVGPLERGDARVHDVAFEVQLATNQPYQPRVVEPLDGPGRSTWINQPLGDRFQLDGGTFFMPVPVISTWHRTELETLDATVQLGDRMVPGAAAVGRLTHRLPFDVQRAEIPFPAFSGESIRFTFRQRSVVWSSRIDDAEAARLPWPETYPEEVRAGLQPSFGIPSDDPFFAGVVQELFGADVTTVPPYVAAKRIAGHVAQEFRVTRPLLWRGLFETIDGLFLESSLLQAARQGAGSPADLVLLTVAVMRSAGIPARPVLGVTEQADDDEVGIDDDETIVVWAEFYLDGAGWVPFDPDELKRNGSWRNRGPEQAWPRFGTWDDLSRRVPMAYDLRPGPDATSPQRWAIYGWLPRGTADAVPTQRVTISMSGGGRVDA